MTGPDLEDKAKKAAGLAAGAALLGKLVVQVEGRPVKQRGKPAKVRVLGLPVFERLDDGRQYLLWWRIRDARKDA